MAQEHSTEEVEEILRDLAARVQKPECWTCDSLQAFLVQVELDAEPAAADVVRPLRASREKMHRCLGCRPCPPGEAHTAYRRRQLGDEGKLDES